MFYKIVSLISLAFVVGIFGCASERYTQVSRRHTLQSDTLKKMTQQEVIDMSKAGISDSLIIGMMDATDTWFQLKPKDIINLKNAGVSDKVISAMIQQPSESTDKSSGSKSDRYYVLPPYYWYDGFYPYYWSYPWFSLRFGHHPSYHFHHGRFR